MTSILRRVESTWNQGPFPHAGFASSGATSGTTDPSVIRRGPVTSCQVGGDTPPPQRTSRVALSTVVNVPSSLPRRSGRQLRSSCILSPTVTAFPDIWAGRPPHCPFRGLLNVHACYGPLTCSRPKVDFCPASSDGSVALAAVAVATRLERHLPGRDSHPLVKSAFRGAPNVPGE